MTVQTTSLRFDFLSGGTTVLWYALPDVVRHRRGRVFAKVVLLLGAGAYAFHEDRRERRRSEASGTSEISRTREPSADHVSTAENQQEGRSPSTPGMIVGSAAVLLLLIGTAAGASRVGRAIFDYGEKLAQRGVTWPHTRIGVVLGLITAVFNLVVPAVERTVQRSA